MDDSPPIVTFPTVYWDFLDRWATFAPCEALLDESVVKAVVVFAWCEGGFVLANIAGRGWCTPSGRVEPGETLIESALRETHEETGGLIDNVRMIGRYEFKRISGDTRVFPAFLGSVQSGGEIPAGSESLGSRLVSRAELPEIYFRWDELLERVFEFAERVAIQTGI
jgi:8-oxo-dGTP diphosphatase